jgi:hypothetical protein
MSATVTLQFVGTRRQDFTLRSPTDSEVSYYVQPGQPVEVSAVDADALIARDPHLWECAEKDVQAEPKSAKRKVES